MLIKTSIKPAIMSAVALLVASVLFLVPSNSMAGYIKFQVSPDAKQIYCHFKVVRKNWAGTSYIYVGNWSAPVKAGGSYSAKDKAPLFRGGPLEAVVASCNPYEIESGILPTGYICIKPSVEHEVSIANNRIVFSGRNPAKIQECSYK